MQMVGFRAGHVRFGMPASLGAVKASTLSLQLGSWLRKLLAPEVKVEMHVAESYGALIEDFRSGRVDAAWAPPLVCAEVEREGGRHLVQFERGGSTRFRAPSCAAPIIFFAWTHCSQSASPGSRRSRPRGTCSLGSTCCAPV